MRSFLNLFLVSVLYPCESDVANIYPLVIRPRTVKKYETRPFKSECRTKNEIFEAKSNGHFNKSERSLMIEGDNGRYFKPLSVSKIETFEIDGLH